MYKNVKLEMIVAATSAGEIGVGNAIPWDLPGDMKHFKDTTMGHVVVMGRKTYESIGRPLPGRSTVVISPTMHSSGQGYPGVYTLPDLKTAIENVEKNAATVTEERRPKIIVAGGASLYSLAMRLPCKIHLTLVNKKSPLAYDTVIPNFFFRGMLRIGEPKPVFEDNKRTGVPELSHTYMTYFTNVTSWHALDEPYVRQPGVN